MRVAHFGVELEGAWNVKPPAPIKPDGSVRVSGKGGYGEIASDPFKFQPRKKEFFAWLCANYPHIVDASCGLHIHMSFEPNIKSIVALMERGFTGYLIHNLIAFAKRKKLPAASNFWSRIQDQNKYCRTVSHPDGIISKGSRGPDDDRYRAVNFKAYHRHGTVEIRVLPMFVGVKHAFPFIIKVLNLTNQFLSKAAKEKWFDIEENSDVDVGQPEEKFSHSLSLVELEEAVDIKESISAKEQLKPVVLTNSDFSTVSSVFAEKYAEQFFGLEKKRPIRTYAMNTYSYTSTDP